MCIDVRATHVQIQVLGGLVQHLIMDSAGVSKWRVNGRTLIFYEKLLCLFSMRLLITATEKGTATVLQSAIHVLLETLVAHHEWILPILYCVYLFCHFSCVPSAYGCSALHREASHLGFWLHRWSVCGLQKRLLPGQRQQVLQQGRVWGVLRGDERWCENKTSITEQNCGRMQTQRHIYLIEIPQIPSPWLRHLKKISQPCFFFICKQKTQFSNNI